MKFSIQHFEHGQLIEWNVSRAWFPELGDIIAVPFQGRMKAARIIGSDKNWETPIIFVQFLSEETCNSLEME
jgi:hypothetical protein